jgi:spore coat polysaccharide biosynthesis protein SpsF
MSADAVVVLQARMGSRRLPGKSLELIDGVPLVTLCLRRLIASDVGPVLLATTTEPEDDALVTEAARLNVRSVRGSRDDVLDRFVRSVSRSRAALVVRATGDNPAIDIEGARRAVKIAQRFGVDYCCERDLPFGAAVEVIRTSALIDAGARATRGDDREHVTTYIRRHTARYRLAEPDAPPSVRRPHVRLTVDTHEDLAFMRAVSSSVAGGLAQAEFDEILSVAEMLGVGSEVVRA